MPNWCDNTLEVSHEDPKMVDRVVQAFTAGRLCEEFIPSPNGEWDWDFSVNNWGTKWDVGGDQEYIERDETAVHMTFQSAWSPPMGLYEKLYALGFQVKAYYYEPGMGFCGIYENGIDEEYNTDDELPEDLDEMFAITENQEGYDD